jgi:hypothetical protein
LIGGCEGSAPFRALKTLAKKGSDPFPLWTRHAAYELGWIGADKLAWPKQYDTLNRNYVWRFETAKE